MDNRNPTQKNTDIDGYMPAVISRDGGRSWEVSATVFPAQGTNQRPCVLRLRSGRIIFAADFQHFRGQKPEGMTRSGSYVAFSDDDGKTWSFRALPGAQQHESPQWHNGAATLGYSALRQAPNGTIHLIATMNRPCLHFAFNEAWLDASSEASRSDAELMRSTANEVAGVQTIRETYSDGTKLWYICPIQQIIWDVALGRDEGAKCGIEDLVFLENQKKLLFISLYS